MDLCVFHPVKGIISNQHKIMKLHIPAVHREIIPFRGNLLHHNPFTVPQRFSRIGQIHLLQHQPMTPAEILRCFDDRIFHRDIVRIPYSRTRHFKPGTIFRQNIFAVPQRIFPLKHAAEKFNIMTFLQRRFPVRKNSIINFQIISLEKRTFTC